MARLDSRKSRNARRRGMVAAQVAICLVPLLGVAAFAIDCGLLLEYRRRTQAAADSAALAAAEDLYANYVANGGVDTNGTAAASARATASANSFNNDGSTSTVTVNIPPTSGLFVNQAGFAEVIITYYQARGFSGIFGSGNIPVTSRAVARGLWTSYANGIILLDPSSSGALDDTGNGPIIVNGGASIIIDSSSASAAISTGSGNISASQFLITGSPGDITSGKGAFIGAIESGQVPTVDPLAYLPEPSSGSLTTQSTSQYKLSSNAAVSISPGVYVGGISYSGGGTLTLNPGIYYLQGGGFAVTGPGNVTGSGVMIYNAPSSSSDKITFTGGGLVTLSPPTTGIYQGITIFQDRTSSAPIALTGPGSVDMSGTVYAAHALLNLTGQGSNNNYGGQYIVYDLTVTGNGAVNMTWTSSGTSRTRRIGLVE